MNEQVILQCLRFGKCFELLPDPAVRSQVRIKDMKKGVDLFDPAPIYGTMNPAPLETLLDYMDGSQPIISGELKELLERFDDGLHVRRIRLKDQTNGRKRKRYWFAQPQPINALHERSVRDSLGTVTIPRFDGQAVRDHAVFCVLGLRMTRWFVSLAVAESLLRESLIGFALKEVELLEGV